MNFIDTNVLVDYPEIITEKTDVCILDSVLKELDNLAHSKNYTLVKKVAKASAYLEEHLDAFTSLEGYNTFADDDLILAAHYNDSCIWTNDRILRIRASHEGIKAYPYFKEVKPYTGMTYYKSPEDDEKIAELFSPEFDYPYENHYFVVHCLDQETVYCWRAHKLRCVDRDSLKITDTYAQRVIKPLNVEQIALMDALQDKSRTIVYAGGCYGSGKSYLTTAYAIDQLEHGKINKIVYVPNNSQGRDTMEIGTLPGDEYMKFVAYMGTLTDIMGELNVEQACKNGQLEIMPIGLARGRNLENAIVIVNEAQNLTGDHIKLLLARCANKTRIFFDGDIKQTDQQVFSEKSGLQLLTCLKDSEEYKDLFSMVILNKTERSRTAQAAQFLDEIQ